MIVTVTLPLMIEEWAADHERMATKTDNEYERLFHSHCAERYRELAAWTREELAKSDVRLQKSEK